MASLSAATAAASAPAGAGAGGFSGLQQSTVRTHSDRTSHQRDEDEPVPGNGPERLPDAETLSDGDAVPITLQFSDVDNEEIVKLGPFQQHSDSHPHFHQSHSTPKSSFSSSTATTITNTASSTPTTNTAVTTTPASNLSSHSAKSSAPGQTRKPSPGLAARLKALGFGGSRKEPATSRAPPPANVYVNPDLIGRLPEDQIRELDQKHIAGSDSIIVEKRGRPWKGPGPLSLISRPSLDSLRRRTTPTASSYSSYSSDDNRSGEPSPNNAVFLAADSTTPITSTIVSPAPDHLGPVDILPPIASSPPLDMDTNKYRLPDHTNGNGTKVQLATRQEHLERDTRPPSPHETPPPPPAKDTPPLSFPEPTYAVDPTEQPQEPTDPFSFNPLGLQRPGSIYTLSRASFANQLAQLTSLQLPDAASLSGKVSAIPTADAAVRALIHAAEQIRGWIYKASEVIGGLDSDDDVEWAAAGGREGLAEVENAITRFEDLIKVYISAIEQLQGRPDISSVRATDNQRAVAQMEIIVSEWEKIHVTLQSVKMQVEIAMEWEELWEQVLSDIQNEMDELVRLVFEMEERRHRVASGEGVDINDLETIVEESTPSQPVRLQAGSRFSLPTFPLSPSSPKAQNFSQDDSSLLALFARMQPLRASLDFLPMRLSGFMHRAETTFPMACEELDMKKAALEASYKKLEKDAESLRKELGEDRWLIVFRGAGRQALKMYESVERSVVKLKEALDAGMHLTNQPAMLKKIESFDAKKTHYSPAIERILTMIEKGVRDRLTVNGEIMRLHMETRTKWDALKEMIRDMDSSLEEIQAEQRRSQQLRDSVSSMLSIDRSTIGSETPGSSPPSSVIMSTLGLGPKTPVAKKGRASSMGSSHLPQPRRNTSMPSPASGLPRKPGSRLSMLSHTPQKLSSPVTPAKSNSKPVDNRPRWNGSTNTGDAGIGHNFKPLALTTPSPYSRGAPTPARSTTSNRTPESRASKLPTLKSPGLSRAGSESPAPDGSPTPARTTSRLAFRDRCSTPGPYSQQTLNANKPRRLNSVVSTANLSAANRRASLQPPKPGMGGSQPTRPASSLASGRRTSMLPAPPRSQDASVSGRESPQAVAGARAAMKKHESKVPESKMPRWRY